MGRVCTTTNWDEQEIELMKKLWSAGHSATQIAGQLSKLGRRFFTRNAVIGKVHRMDLPKRQTYSRPVKRRPKTKMVRVRIPSKIVALNVVPTEGRIIYRDEPLSNKLPLTQLEEHHCRWSTHEEGEHLFCGHDREEGKAWCPYHARKAVTKDSEKKLRGAQRVVEHYVRQERRAA